MTNLSPTAQAVMNAWIENTNYAPIDNEPFALAAALRAAADQMSCYQSKKFLYSIADAMKLYAIATELEGLQ